ARVRRQRVSPGHLIHAAHGGAIAAAADEAAPAAVDADEVLLGAGGLPARRVPRGLVRRVAGDGDDGGPRIHYITLMGVQLRQTE
ncbi:unnamed protein product, partial [Prorocentrum cordatum]